MTELPPVPAVDTAQIQKDFLSAPVSTSGRTRPSTRGSTAPAPSTEVISSLISSLSSISSPADDFYDSLLPEATGRGRSSSPSKSRIRDEVISEEPGQNIYLRSEEVAGSPVVRTSRHRPTPSSSSSTRSKKRSSMSSVFSPNNSSTDSSSTTPPIGTITITPGNFQQPEPISLSRANSIRSFTFGDSSKRIRDQEKRSKSGLGRFSPVPSMRSSREIINEDSIATDKKSNRTKSMYVMPTLPTLDFAPPPTVGNGMSVPTRDSSARHSFSPGKRSSKPRSIQGEPVAEAAGDTPSNALGIDLPVDEVDDVAKKIQRLKSQREAREKSASGSIPAVPKRRRPLMDSQSLAPAQTPRSASAADSRDKENIDPFDPKRSMSRKSLSRSLTEPIPEERKKPLRPPPSIVDSIDDDTQQYLNDPRLSQKVKDPITGRVIAYSEVGDPEGSVVICCVGMGTTRFLTAFYDELATTLKLRLITPDRPGIGESDAFPDGVSTPLLWPDDVRTICAHLGIQRFSVMAHSAGAVYALATALRMPQHIRGRIHLLAPWIPPSQMVAVGIQKDHVPITTLPYSQRLLRSLPTSFLKIANSSLFAMTSSSVASAMPARAKRNRRRSASDAEASREKQAWKLNVGSKAPAADDLAQDAKPYIMDSPSSTGRSESALSKLKEREAEYDYRLIHAIWDAATTNANPAVDLMVCLERRQEIGFRYADINKEVVIHHGSKDTRVPVENIEWLGGRMRRCEVRVLEGEGHGLMASAKVMSDVLSEMAQEWANWNAIVGRAS